MYEVIVYRYWTTNTPGQHPWEEIKNKNSCPEPTIFLVSFQKMIAIHDTEFNNPTEFRKQTSKSRTAQVTQIYRAGNGAREEEEGKEGNPASVLETHESVRQGLCYALMGQDSKWHRAAHSTETRWVKQCFSREKQYQQCCSSGPATGDRPMNTLSGYRPAPGSSQGPQLRSKTAS